MRPERFAIRWFGAKRTNLSSPYIDSLRRFPNRRPSHQMRRAAVSIAATIAEGFRKRSKADKVRFLNMAEGSVEESRYYLILAQDLGYGKTETLMNSLAEVSRLLAGHSDF